jgi:hypothetical protein
MCSRPYLSRGLADWTVFHCEFVPFHCFQSQVQEGLWEDEHDEELELLRELEDAGTIARSTYTLPANAPALTPHPHV